MTLHGSVHIRSCNTDRSRPSGRLGRPGQARVVAFSLKMHRNWMYIPRPGHTMLGHTIGHAQPDGVMLLGILSFLQFFQADVDYRSKPPSGVVKEQQKMRREPCSLWCRHRSQDFCEYHQYFVAPNTCQLHSKVMRVVSNTFCHPFIQKNPP